MAAELESALAAQTDIAGFLTARVRAMGPDQLAEALERLEQPSPPFEGRGHDQAEAA